MKIALFDPYLLKFTDGMIRWWQNKGHEVRYERYYNPKLVEWGDVVWFFTCDNNLKSATNPDIHNPDFAGYDMHGMDLSGKQIVVQPIDIECWQGHQLASKWDVVDDVVFIADHIRKITDESSLPLRRDDLRVHTIPFSIDVGRFSFAERSHGYNIAVIAERWGSKGTDLILQIAYKLKNIDSRYKITWLGRRSDYAWEHAYRDDFIEHHQLPIECINWLEGENAVNDFLEDKNYLLSCSHKEAFGANIAEAMAKGIKPVVHRFYGADELWDRYLWSSIDEAIEMITGGPYNSREYRASLYVRGNDLDSMMDRIMSKVIKGE